MFSTLVLDHPLRRKICSHIDSSFPFLKAKTPGYDPIIGQNGTNPVFSSGIDYKHPDQNSTFMSFILSRGGEYLYSPSMSAILDPIAA